MIFSEMLWLGHSVMYEYKTVQVLSTRLYKFSGGGFQGPPPSVGNPDMCDVAQHIKVYTCIYSVGMEYIYTCSIVNPTVPRDLASGEYICMQLETSPIILAVYLWEAVWVDNDSDNLI